MGPKAKPSLNKSRGGVTQRGARVSAGASDVAAGESFGLRLWLIALGLAVLVVVAYGNSADNGFVWDDHQQIVLNPSVRADAPLGAIFTSDVRFTAHTQGLQGKDYRPLQMLTYRLLFGAFGADASIFHATSIGFAVACALAAFAVLWRLTGRWKLASAAAALFAVQPVHAEAVDWIVCLDDLGFALFVLLAFFWFLGSRENVQAGGGRRMRWVPAALSWVAFGVALLWKETAIIFPVVVASYVRVRAALLRSAPYWVVLGGYLALRVAMLGGLSAGVRDWELTPVQFALSGLWLMVSYWAKLALPVHLNAYYVFTPVRSVTDVRGMAAVVVVLAVAAAVVFLLRGASAENEATQRERSPRRLAVFAAVWVVLWLLPAMNLSALGRNAFTERYLYVASAGFCLLVVLGAAWALERLPVGLRTPVGAVVLAVVVVGYTAETMARNPDWKDDATLFGVTLEASPDAPFVRNMVAAAESADPAESAEAERNYVASIAAATGETPVDRLDAVVAYQGLASVYADRGQFAHALQTLDAASRIDPDDADTDGEKGMILAHAGRGLEAEPLLRHALAEKPDNENVLSALGLVARDDLHDPAQAATFFLRALAVHPAEDDFAASQHNNLGAAYADAGKDAEAIREIQEAVRILPNDPEFHVNLATAYAAAGRYEEARGEAETAMKLAPNDPAPREILQKLGAGR